MPTYTIQIPGAQLSGERKAALPEAIKDAHPKTTGAARDLTQASVLEISSASFWLHGTPSECHRIFVHGFVAHGAVDEVNAAGSLARASRKLLLPQCR